MDKEHVYELLRNLNVRRDTIFISVSSKDKKKALRLIGGIEKRNLKSWCMYFENGSDRNISGDVYPQVISEALNRCCIFVMLISQNSLNSSEVLKEAKQINAMIEKEKVGIKVIPVMVDDVAQGEIPRDLISLLHITPDVIVRRYDESSPESVIAEICEEIKSQYTVAVLENIEQRFVREKNSHKLNELMSLCARNKCVAQTVSEDIKQSPEISAAHLKEMHILSNELLEYDCNTYSCMVIASNLLGNETMIDGVRKFDPVKNGVKYFYYYPENGKAECVSAFNKIKRFIAKDAASRREVVCLIRREFCHRNKVQSFFREFNHMRQEDFVEQYHIVLDEDRRNLDRLFCAEETQYFLALTDDGDVFQVPEELFIWMNGDSDAYDNTVQVTNDFIRFLDSFIKVLDAAQDINRVSYALLKKRFSYLQRLVQLEEWQMGRLPLGNAEARRLVNYLLDFTADSNANQDKMFPQLARWMEFETTESGERCEIDSETLRAAYDNLISIPVSEKNGLRFSYSFALFVRESEISGAWYSTGRRTAGNTTQDIVMTYNIDRQSAECQHLIDAFCYLIAVNPAARKAVRENESELLKKVANVYGLKDET